MPSAVGIAAIAISPANAPAVAEVLRRRNSPIPIITADADLLPKDASLRKSYVGTDNYELGVKLGEQLKLLMDDAERGANATISVDLEAQTIKGPDGGTIHFDIDPARRTVLLEGLDDIAATMKEGAEIAAFEQKLGADRPWI